MEIFVTGGTGYLGRSVVAEFSRAGHDVVALTRSAERTVLLNALGAVAVQGDLSRPESYRAAAASADAIVHVAIDYGAAVQVDRVALDTLVDATAAHSGHLLYTSGLWVVGDTGGQVVDEEASSEGPAPIVEWRVPHESRVLAADTGERTATVIRPGNVYGRGGGLTSRMFATASRSGAAEFVGDGSNHWPNIHVDDLARLYRLVIERGAGGLIHAADGTPETVLAIAEAASLAAGAEGRTRSVPLEEAREKMGPMADALLLDQRIVGSRARALGWEPEHSSFTASAPRAFQEWREAAAS